MDENKKRKQIIFDINEDIHRQIKIFAATRNITMNRWIQKAITERIKKETQYDKDNEL